MGGIACDWFPVNDAEWWQVHKRTSLFTWDVLPWCRTGRLATVFYIVWVSALSLVILSVWWREYQLWRNLARLFSFCTVRPVAMVLPVGTVALLASQCGVWRGAWRAAPQIHFRVTHILRAVLLPYIWVCVHTPTQMHMQQCCVSNCKTIKECF